LNVNIAVFDHDEVLLAYLSGLVLSCPRRRHRCLLGSSDFACALRVAGILAALVQLLLQQMLLIDELSILLTRAGGESRDILLASTTA
jgi:hypothetical protein